LDEDAEETKFTPLPDGRTVCTHGNGTNQIRVVDAAPSEEAHVYDISPSKIFQYPPLIPMMMQTPQFQNSFVGSCKYLIGSQCGRLFDQYFRQVIKEPTAYSANGGQEKDVPQLWPNRRLKLKFSEQCDSWVEGRVLKFKNMCTGPYSPCTRWFVDIQFSDNSSSDDDGESSTDLKPGQLVEMHGLKAGKKYNGSYGVIVENKNSEGRYPILLKTGKMLAIKPDNIKGVTTIELEVGRMNVSGGGVLLGEPKGLTDMISFEWIGDLFFKCEPTIQKLEEDEYTLTLEMDPSELKSKQERLQQEFADRTPSIYGAPDCNQDRSPINTPKRRAFQKYMKEEFGPRFFGLAKTDLRGFEELLMTEPLGLWHNNELAEGMHEEVFKNPAALKVMYAVVKSRYQSGDVEANGRWIMDTFGAPPGYSHKSDYDRWQSNFSFFIGECYGSQDMSSRAIPWLEESIERTKGGYNDPIVLAQRQNYQAHVYRKMGLLSKAFRLNREACKQSDRSELPVAYEDKNSLLKELKIWTGTSGYFLSEDGRVTLEEILGASRGESKIDSNFLSLKPHTQVPPHFGVMDDGHYWDPVPVDLPRPLALRSLSKSKSQFDNEEAKGVFMSIYNGKFHVEWKAGSRDDYPDEEFSFASQLPSEANFKFLYLSVSVPDLSNRVMTTYLVSMPFPNNPNQAFFVQTFDTQEPYKSIFTIEQKFILSRRLIHWCVRLFGAKIDQSFKAEQICHYLMQEYAKAENWKDAMDASVIKADFVYKSGNMEHIYYALNTVGEAMESAKEFEAAAKVYGESAKFMVSKTRYSQASTLFQNGGLAYRCCQNFASSESLYVSSLHYDLKSKGNRLNLNDDSFDRHITNMFVNYDMWLNETQAIGAEKNKTVHTVFSCLLYRSGFQARQGGRVGFAVHTLGQQMSGVALNNRCNTTRQCKKALADAIASSPDISTFHSKILACKSARLQSVSFTPDSNIATNGSGTDKGAARERMSSNLAPSYAEDFRQCCSPACGRFVPADEIKYCPCQKVSYCSKDCQKAHWRVHRQTCPTKQGKK